MCASADQRMWAGLVDFTAGDGNLPLHINQRGQEDLTKIIFDRDGRLPTLISSQSAAA